MDVDNQIAVDTKNRIVREWMKDIESPGLSSGNDLNTEASGKRDICKSKKSSLPKKKKKKEASINTASLMEIEKKNREQKLSKLEAKLGLRKETL